MKTLSKKSLQIPFCKPFVSNNAIKYTNEVLSIHNQSFVGGKFTTLSQEKLEKLIDVNKILLTNSCTSALEMSAILANCQPGDEVIMPSFTFPSTANAFVLRGGIPVFVDIRADTLNIDEHLIEKAITPKTKAIVPVHYAGVACEMKTIETIAKNHQLLLIEDAAQAMMSTYKGNPLGQLGDLSAFSFHYTKNITSTVGGCLCINNKAFTERADIIYHNGTNRTAFSKGKVDQYTWMDIGSAHTPSELMAALLFSQLEVLERITATRLSYWNKYHRAFQSEEAKGRVKRPTIPDSCEHNAHIYYLLLPSVEHRNHFIKALAHKGIEASSHFVPLHSSSAGIRFSRTHGSMQHTDDLSQRLVRLPLWIGMEPYLDDIISIALDTLELMF